MISQSSEWTVNINTITNPRIHGETYHAVMRPCFTRRIKKVPGEKKRPHVRYICNKERLGVTVCRDFGVDEARSENVLIIDAHMRFRRDNWVEKGIEAIEKNPNPVPSENIIYNKAVTAKILFTPAFAGELIHFLDGNPQLDKAKELLKANAEEIEAERSYFKTIAKLSPTGCFKKLRIDYTNPLNQS